MDKANKSSSLPTEIGSSPNVTDIGNSSQITRSKPTKKSRKRQLEEDAQNETPVQKSWVWDHFKRDNTVTDADKPKAICNHCGTKIACHPIRNGTSGMNNHLGHCKGYQPNIDAQQTVLTMDKRGESGTNKLVSWSYNKEVSRDKLARMILLDELPFSFVEGEGFKDFCFSLCPTFEPISRRTVCRDVVKLHLTQKAIIKDLFARLQNGVCLTTDAWTSIQNVNYMVLTAHFLDDDWNLHKRIINFCVITDHKGESIGKVVVKCVNEWGIKRVVTITVDNATSNDVAVKVVMRQLNECNKCVLNGDFMHVRCCAHILNLIVNDGLKEIQDSVAHIRLAVKYVRSSPSRLTKFKNFVKTLHIVHKSALILDVPTRWNSTYLMLVSALKYEQVFALMGDEDGHYMAYMNGQSPIKQDWVSAEVFVRFLKSFYDATLKFSCTLSVTSSSCLPDVLDIEDEIKLLIGHEDNQLSEMASSMHTKFDKYWGNMSKMNKYLLIACVLDPNMKMEYISTCFEECYGDEDSIACEIAIKEVKDLLVRLYAWYSERRLQSNRNESLPQTSSQQHDTSSIGDTRRKKHYKKMHQQDVSSNEVDKYLEEPTERSQVNFDIQDWWKVNSVRFNVLSDLAKDVFAIPVSTVASDSAFSTGGRILDPYRSCLASKMVEILVTTQNWIRSKTIKVESLIEDVELYDEVVEELVDLLPPDA